MQRRKLLENALGWGLLAGLFGNKLPQATAAAAPVQDWHAELTNRIAALEAGGGGTLELADGLYEIDKPLLLPISVSLTMTPAAVIRAKPNFQGDAILIKGGGTASKFTPASGWIRGGIIDGAGQPLTGLRVEKMHRLEIADLEILDATFKGIHLLQGGNETNLTRVRCNLSQNTPHAPGSIGIHYQRGDSKVILAHVIGYETAVRDDWGSNWFNMVHAWNWEPTQGPMKYGFYCRGSNNAFTQCYADSPTIAGFFIDGPYHSLVQCSVFFSRWAPDNTGSGVLITPRGKHGTYLANNLNAVKDHRLAKAFDGDLTGACILGNRTNNGVAGFENRIPSGESVDCPPVTLAGGALRLTQQSAPPTPDDGEPGELRYVDDGKEPALWIKTTSGWKKSVLQ